MTSFPVRVERSAPVGARIARRPLPHPAASSARLPVLLALVIGATFVSCVLGEVSVLAFNLRGWMWLVPLVPAIVEILWRRVPRPFPVVLWVPWSAWLAGSLLLSPFENALQRTAMVLAPLVVGYACSGLALGPAAAQLLVRRLRQLAWILFAVILAQLGIVRSLELPATTGLAPQVMTGALLAVYCAAGWAFGVPGSLGAWLAMASLSVIALTRTAIVATALTLPGTFAPLRPRARAVALALVAVAGLALFQTERVQRKMFYSGAGELADLTTDNPDLRSSGRFALWDAMYAEIGRKPLFGHGANAQEDFILTLVHFRGQPHNDWLRVAFDYGWVGVALYAGTILAQALLLLRLARRAWRSPGRSVESRVLLAGGAGSFVVYAAFMVTDNIFLYAAFFGMLQFALVGAAYALDARERAAAASGGGGRAA